jgi:uncharacterized protein with ACT and thioredoxin-like domain
MIIKFSSKEEKQHIIATLQRLIDTINERNISTAEEHNLRIALICVSTVPVEGY